MYGMHMMSSVMLTPQLQQKNKSNICNDR